MQLSLLCRAVLLHAMLDYTPSMFQAAFAAALSLIQNRQAWLVTACSPEELLLLSMRLILTVHPSSVVQHQSIQLVLNIRTLSSKL